MKSQKPNTHISVPPVTAGMWMLEAVQRTQHNYGENTDL